MQREACSPRPGWAPLHWHAAGAWAAIAQLTRPVHWAPLVLEFDTSDDVRIACVGTVDGPTLGIGSAQSSFWNQNDANPQWVHTRRQKGSTGLATSRAMLVSGHSDTKKALRSTI